MASYREKIPERFGQLGLGAGLMFTCTGCTRGTTYSQDELVKRWGEEGRVSDLVARFRCSNCKARRRPPQPIHIELTRMYRTGREENRANMADPVDRLAYDIEQLKPRGKIK